jgi:hypothetical protein
LRLQEEKPFSVKFRMIGPNFFRLRYMMPIGCIPSFGCAGTFLVD